MPEKSVREMNALERAHNSLAARTFHSTIIGAIAFGVAALLIGLGFYTYALIHQHITEAFTLSRSAAAILKEVVDVEPFADDLMVAFHAQNKDGLDQMGTPEYRERPGGRRNQLEIRDHRNGKGGNHGRGNEEDHQQGTGEAGNGEGGGRHLRI